MFPINADSFERAQSAAESLSKKTISSVKRMQKQRLGSVVWTSALRSKCILHLTVSDVAFTGRDCVEAEQSNRTRYMYMWQDKVTTYQQWIKGTPNASGGSELDKNITKCPANGKQGCTIWPM